MATTLVNILLISLTVLLLIVSISPRTKNPAFGRWLCALLSMPACIAAALLIQALTINQGLIATTKIIPLLKVDFGLYITPINAVLISSSIVALQIFFFFSQKGVFSSNLLSMIASTLFLVIMQLPSNLIITQIILSIGTTLITYFRIFDNSDNLAIKDLTRDFIWQRIADFLLAFHPDYARQAGPPESVPGANDGDAASEREPMAAAA